MHTGLQIKCVRSDLTAELHRDEQRLVEGRWVDAQTRGGTATGRPVPSPFTALAGTQGPKGTDMAGFVTEVMPSFQHWDPHGYVWGRPGHWPLWVMLGPGRYRSDDGWAERAVRSQKLMEWKLTGRWPWWRYHESEKFFWLPGSISTGRGFTGCEADVCPAFPPLPRGCSGCLRKPPTSESHPIHPLPPRRCPESFECLHNTEEFPALGDLRATPPEFPRL